MIQLNDETPVWIHNLDRYLALKNLLLLHGNIHDDIPFDAIDPKAPHPYPDHCHLPQFILRFLAENKGYPVAGVLDPLQNLIFFDEIRPNEIRMRPQYMQLAKTAGHDFNSENSRGWTSLSELENGINEMCDVLKNRRTPCAFVIHIASRLLTSPDNLDNIRLQLFTRIQMACENGPEVMFEGKSYRNVVVLLCDKMNDLPAFLFVDNPSARSICVPKPDRRQRKRFFQANYSSLPGVQSDATPNPKLADDFVDGTEDLTFKEIYSLVPFSDQESKRQNLDFSGLTARRDLARLLATYRHGSQANEWSELKEKLATAEETITKQVQGQKAAIRHVLDIIKGSKYGIEAGSSGRSKRPRGILFFAGPTGVGKTELAKAIAEAIFGDENRLIRFDMSEYRAEHSDQRLLGAPPGYVGYQEGGQLTNAVKQQPCSVLLFDEIEKAHENIFLKFLQILDDGRLTDGHGETVYFSESILVFTSNEGMNPRPENKDDEYGPIDQTWDPERIREVFRRRIEWFFVDHMGRRELFNRFGKNFVVFDFIERENAERILMKFLQSFKEAHMDRNGMEIEIQADVVKKLKEICLDSEALKDGGRGIRNALDSALVKPFHRALFDEGVEDPKKVSICNLTTSSSSDDYKYSVKIDAE